MKKDLLIVGFIVVILSIVFSGTKIQSVDEYYMTHADDIRPDSEIVTVSIQATTLIGHENRVKPELRRYIPKNGVILKPTKYVLRKDDTAFDILQRATRQERIQMEYQGADKNIYKSAYIQGINYLYEFSAGEGSGWMYQVNGKFPNVGVSRYRLRDGDTIDFLYTTNLGDDIGGGM
ncbi:DUF4430 domain-containing protein [Rummeliibacillus suwonensis]|uniref:DUF4430 domain-containing protein n=1 Tax=Rummeliibacillus suwonensis TaxID=1306154 RepID=UPI0028984BCC|nr:DUF4430 domain-containing protein [Rummeliibacillus suwonensis]